MRGTTAPFSPGEFEGRGRVRGGPCPHPLWSSHPTPRSAVRHGSQIIGQGWGRDQEIVTATPSPGAGRSDPLSQTIVCKTPMAPVLQVGHLTFVHHRIHSRSAKLATGLYHVRVDSNQQPQTPASHRMLLIREMDEMNIDISLARFPSPSRPCQNPKVLSVNEAVDQ